MNRKRLGFDKRHPTNLQQRTLGYQRSLLWRWRWLGGGRWVGRCRFSGDWFKRKKAGGIDDDVPCAR